MSQSEKTEILSPSDYGRSFVLAAGAAHGNAPLFWLESRCRIIDPCAKVERDYYQCCSCKSEDTFAEKDLFLTPNYDFLPVFAHDHAVIFRRYASAAALGRPYQSVVPLPWGPVQPKIRHAKALLMNDGKQIAESVAAARPFIGQVEISERASGRSAIIEFPIKTMNRGTDGIRWQVDTGPVALPDLTQPPDKWAQSLRLAFVAFRTDDWADFVIEAPTPVIEGGREVAMVHHYSEIIHLPTLNKVFALECFG